MSMSELKKKKTSLKYKETIGFSLPPLQKSLALRFPQGSSWHGLAYTNTSILPSSLSFCALGSLVSDKASRPLPRAVLVVAQDGRCMDFPVA